MTFKRSIAATTLLTAALSLGAHAQQATSQDKDFLKNTGEDSNYEIKTAKLVLQKATSADVKAYATMLIKDHTALNRQVLMTDKAVQVEPVKTGSMSISDDASYAEMKVLSGKTFEEHYIKSLAKGNEESVNNEKSEVAGTQVPAIKTLAEHALALDTKHTEKAKALAQAHNIQ